MLSAEIIPTHTVATWLISTIDGVLNKIGLGHDRLTEEIIYIILISLISVGIGIGIKKLVLYITRKAVKLRHSELGQQLIDRKVLTRSSHIIPPLVFMGLIPFAFNSDSSTLVWIMKFVGIYALIAFGIGVNAVLGFIFDRINARENRKNLPIKGILNVAIGIVWIIIIIVAISIIVDKSPGALLAGLGAFAAALMLIFKDSILGFVAGIQMSDNDMLHVGDWIVVPGTPANGIVMDVSLSTVKVQNWDMTYVTVPPYTLVSTSFQNYRGMVEAGARRIDTTMLIDIPTIKTLQPDEVDSIVSKYPVLSPFVDSLKAKNTAVRNDSGARAANGSVDTNLGLFRAYVGLYLAAHPLIAQDQRILVRLQQSNPSGIPLDIWCFTATTQFDEYEGIQSEILEHLNAIIGDFAGLGIYSSSSVTVSEDTPEPASASKKT